MAALSDLDMLLSDLEQTCNSQRSTVSREKEFLSDCSDARNSSTSPEPTPMGFQLPRKKETDSVIKEMEHSGKLTTERKQPFNNNGQDLDSKWEYKGYGVWENSETGSIQNNNRSSFSNAASGRYLPSAASSATQELDELMSSLNSFKMDKDNSSVDANDGSAGGKVREKEFNLDAMLDNLQENMDKHGIKNVPKGVCSACMKPIVGQVVTALGKTWHPEHFVCAHCNLELGSKSFFERDGKSYCEKDYHFLFSPRCGACKKAILDKCVSALDQTFHPECFVCFECHKSFDEDGFHEKDGRAFCRNCFFNLFAPKCGGCEEPIIENYISSLDRQWHPKCFVCTECKEPFTAGNFFEHGGMPYCEMHYHALRGSLCAGCQKPISGRCITAMFKKFHPEHFVCSFCLKQLNKGTFKERNEKPYCHDCHDRLFG